MLYNLVTIYLQFTKKAGLLCMKNIQKVLIAITSESNIIKLHITYEKSNLVILLFI